MAKLEQVLVLNPPNELTFIGNDILRYLL